MKNLIKSIIYETMRSKLLIIFYLVMVAVMILLGALNACDYTTSGLYIQDQSITYIFPLTVTALVVGIVICPDLKDKVANYEILSGHSRISVYLARVLCAIIPAAFLSYFLTFLPMISGILFWGWGDRLDLTDVLLRQALFIFPFIRLAAFTCVLAFMIKSEYAMIAIGVAYSFGTLFLSGIFEEASSSVFVSIYNFSYLMGFDRWTIYNISPESGIIRYASATGSISSEMIVSTITASMLMTLVYVVLGYALFRRNEMN